MLYKHIFIGAVVFFEFVSADTRWRLIPNENVMNLNTAGRSIDHNVEVTDNKINNQLRGVTTPAKSLDEKILVGDNTYENYYYGEYSSDTEPTDGGNYYSGYAYSDDDDGGDDKAVSSDPDSVGAIQIFGFPSFQMVLPSFMNLRSMPCPFSQSQTDRLSVSQGNLRGSYMNNSEEIEGNNFAYQNSSPTISKRVTTYYNPSGAQTTVTTISKGDSLYSSITTSYSSRDYTKNLRTSTVTSEEADDNTFSNVFQNMMRLSSLFRTENLTPTLLIPQSLTRQQPTSGVDNTLRRRYDTKSVLNTV